MKFQARAGAGAHGVRPESDRAWGSDRGHRLHHNGAIAVGHETLAGLQNHVCGDAGLGEPQPPLPAVDARAADVTGNAAKRIGLQGQLDRSLADRAVRGAPQAELCGAQARQRSLDAVSLNTR